MAEMKERAGSPLILLYPGLLHVKETSYFLSAGFPTIGTRGAQDI